MNDDRITAKCPKKLKKDFVEKCNKVDSDKKPSGFIRQFMKEFLKRK